MQWIGKYALGLVVVSGVIMWGGSAWADSGWQRVGWTGVHMGGLVISPQQPQEMAVVADGTLELSHDGGVVWLQSALSARVNVVAYDSVQTNWLYAGTDTGLYVSHDRGLSWQRFESMQTLHKITVALGVDNQYVFASMDDGAGTPVQVFRISRDGVASDTIFPAGNADCFAVDAGRQRLYVGAAGGVYTSDDEGGTWQGGGHGAGTFTAHIVVKPGMLWQLSADGLFRSLDDGQSWDRLAGPGDINGTYYGSGMHLSGLGVSNGAAYYGAWSIGFPYQFLAAYDGGAARSIFNGRVNEVATAGGKIWIATDDGLWVNSQMVGTEAAVRRPVIIVPGILGSLPTSEALKSYATATIEEGYWDHAYKTPLELDPILHTYDGLMNYLLARGYRRDSSLFVFPYNWTQDNAATGRQLTQKIQDVRRICSCSQVDIVAHSMGGLIARTYIQSDSYQGDVANLIQLGTPNTGAVEDYQVWESGEYDGLSLPNQFFNTIVRALMSPATDTEKVAVVRHLMPSIEQLLPIFNYLTGRQYPAGYPRNRFLEDLDQPSEITRLKQRTAVYVVGANTKPTLLSLGVGPTRPGDSVWPDGMISTSTQGPGDNTVLQPSLEAVDPASLLLDTDHGGVVTAAAPFVAQTLMGGYIDEPAAAPPESSPASRYLLVYVSGTVSLNLRTSNGSSISNASIGIPGAYYSGSDTTPQLMAIPNPSAGAYHLGISGNGPFTVGVSTIDAGADAAGPIQVSGSVSAGQTQQFIYDAGAQNLQREGPGVEAALMPVSAGERSGLIANNTAIQLLAMEPVAQTWRNQTPDISRVGFPPQAPPAQLFPNHHRFHGLLNRAAGRYWWMLIGAAVVLLLTVIWVLQ